MLVRVRVFDALGRQVRELVNLNSDAGTFDVLFDATGLPSGVYFYTLESGGTVQAKRMTPFK